MAAKKKAKKVPAKKAAPAAPVHPLMLNGKDWDREKVMDYLCDQIATSARGLGTVLKAGYEGHTLPSYSQIMRWINEDQAICESYTRAKEAQADYLADEMLDIADDARNDWMERSQDEKGTGYIVNGEHVQRTRLRIETRKWLMGKLKPKKYGDKVQHTGEGGGPIEHDHRIDLSDLDKDERAALAGIISRRAGKS